MVLGSATDIGSLSFEDRARSGSEGESTRNQPILVGLSLEFFAEIGMGNVDNHASALRYGFPLQVDHTVLGDDVHRVRAWRSDDVAWRQARYDAAAAPAAFLVRGGEANEGLATR